LPQPELLLRLADHNISITSQTLRNWEKNALIIPPKRGGKRGGRTSDYCEFVLAEAFAVYTLTQAEIPLHISGTEVQLPKFSLLHLSIAREQVRKANCLVPNFPAPPFDSVGGVLQKYDTTEFKESLPKPDFSVLKSGKLSVNAAHKLVECDIATHFQYHFFQTLYISWFNAVSQGCDVFLSHYKR